MRRSLVLDVGTRVITGSAIVLSVYLLAAGHNQPGGGFIGGLVGGAAIAIAYVGGGLDQVRQFTRVRPWTILGGGLMIAAMAAIVPLILGGDVLEQGFATLHPPVLGDVKVTSALIFDSGVYAVVVGTVFMAFEALGEEGTPDDDSGTVS
ncbi:MnhB domain-containing protein [Actinospongicola halichondriae]|uniref:MnhB domain-containing protein n=1 Tax=Actinospongicola halichondriae TaxID=3236844 RepID=UPI003D50F646